MLITQLTINRKLEEESRLKTPQSVETDRVLMLHNLTNSINARLYAGAFDGDKSIYAGFSIANSLPAHHDYFKAVFATVFPQLVRRFADKKVEVQTDGVVTQEDTRLFIQLDVTKE